MLLRCKTYTQRQAYISKLVKENRIKIHNQLSETFQRACLKRCSSSGSLCITHDTQHAFLVSCCQVSATNDRAEPHSHCLLVCIITSVTHNTDYSLTLFNFQILWVQCFQRPPPFHAVIYEIITTFATSANVSHFKSSLSRAECPPTPPSCHSPPFLSLAAALIARGPAAGDMTRVIGPLPLETPPAIWYQHWYTSNWSYTRIWRNCIAAQERDMLAGVERCLGAVNWTVWTVADSFTTLWARMKRREQTLKLSIKFTEVVRVFN